MIFLTILKIIGIVLLCLFIFILLVLALLLFVPIRYRVEASTFEDGFGDLSAKISAHWLLYLISYRGSYSKETSFIQRLKLLGFTIFPKKEKSQKEKSQKEKFKKEKPKNKKANKPDSNINQSGLADNEQTVDNILSDSKDEESANEENESLDSDFTESDALEAAPEKKKGQKKGKGKQQKASKKKEKGKRTEFFGNIQSKYEKWKKILTDKHNQNAMNFLKTQLNALLKCIMPGKLHLNAEYSTGSPDTTAEVLGVLAMFPIGYINRWKIYPDFEADAFYLKGNADLKGTIYLYQIIWIAAKVFFNKECKRLYRMIKRQ